MKLKRLDLKAFGPFTDRSLVFDSKEPGLHVIFGPNEAGKSSSLRGLKALLYGFHGQTPDDFIHPYKQLLVGGCLQSQDGQEISFQRRKGSRNDLLDAEGNVIDKSELVFFLQGVEPEIFASLYGIDHKSLVEGGNEILSQQGELGQALFAAGAGLSSLKTVIDQLDEEAAELFKPSGSKPKINQAIKRFKELKREAKEVSLSSREWKDQQKALKDAEDERKVLEEKRKLKNNDLRRLERLQQAIPVLSELEIWQEQIDKLGEVTSLPPDFAQRLQDVEQAIREASMQKQHDSERLEQTEKKRQAISLNRAVLEHAEQVDDFYQRLGEYNKAQKDRPVLDGMRISLRREAAGLLQQIRPELTLQEVESLRPVLSKRKTIQALISQFELREQQVRAAQQQVSAAERELKAVATALEELAAIATPVGTHGLDQAVKLARKAGELDKQIARWQSEAEQDNQECIAELRRIGRWSGELAALQQLALPLSETIQRYEDKYSEIEQERRGLEKDWKAAEKELKSVLAELRRIDYGGEVPSEEELSLTREKRQQGWQLLRRQWLDGEDVREESRAYYPEMPLPEAYEGLVSRADLLADRLRHEADRVASAAALRSQKDSLEKSLKDYAQLKEMLDRRETEQSEAWAEVWSPLAIEPLSPKEMSGWLMAMEKLRYRAGELLKKRRQIQDEETRRQELCDRLLSELAAMGIEEPSDSESLAPLLLFCESKLEEIEGRKTEQKRLDERKDKTSGDLTQAREGLEEAQGLLKSWQEQWKKSLSGLGLAEEISVHEANDYLDILQKCLDKEREASDLSKRIIGIDRDAKALEDEVREVLQQVAPDMLELPLGQAIQQLRSALAQAREDRTRYDQLSNELESLKNAVSIAEKKLEDANEQMAKIQEIAKCEKQEDIAKVIERFLDHGKLQEKLNSTKASLARIGAGTSVEELARQAAEVDANELPGRIDSLRNKLEEEINPAINQISQDIGEKNNRLKAMDGSDKAAEVSEQMEQELARIRRLAERYTKLKLASKILQQEIEGYREAHQDPVLKIAGKYFSELTLNSFAGIKADVDDRGGAILVGVRPDGRTTSVEGMSDGTRDQLFLALRIASLEWRLNTSEPMPFIVDDILINFDDDRAQATLSVLANLGRKNQVILFTHHRQVAEEAKRLKEKGLAELYLL